MGTSWQLEGSMVGEIAKDRYSWCWNVYDSTTEDFHQYKLTWTKKKKKLEQKKLTGTKEVEMFSTLSTPAAFSKAHNDVIWNTPGRYVLYIASTVLAIQEKAITLLSIKGNANSVLAIQGNANTLLAIQENANTVLCTKRNANTVLAIKGNANTVLAIKGNANTVLAIQENANAALITPGKLH